jgi:hypothetical protein
MYNSVGILAYGSLIGDPGPELSPLIINIISVETPFGIEYGRKSRTRGYAPTLTIAGSGGIKVPAIVLILDPKTDITEAKNMLYRRERRIYDSTLHYCEPILDSNKMIIRELENFQNVSCVIYVDLPSNIEQITPENLACLAISSAKSDAGKRSMDGITYLKDNIANGIITPLTRLYEQEILRQSGKTSLQAAIDFYLKNE